MNKLEIFQVMTKQMKCPDCKSENVAQILTGLPDMTRISQKDIDDGKIILGGCLVGENDPDWHDSFLD